jgi:hypothetical protein
LTSRYDALSHLSLSDFSGGPDAHHAGIGERPLGVLDLTDELVVQPHLERETLPLKG